MKDKEPSTLELLVSATWGEMRLLEERLHALGTSIDEARNFLEDGTRSYNEIATRLAASTAPAVIVSTSCKCAGCEGEVAWSPSDDAWRCFRCVPRDAV